MKEKTLPNGDRIQHADGVDPVLLTDTEKATLSALFACRSAIQAQINAYQHGPLAERLGVHGSKILHIDLDTGIVTLRSEANAR